VFDQMEKLDKNEIDVEQAKAQSNLVKQANNILRYELDRAKTEMKITEHNQTYSDTVRLRQAEIKNFE